MQKIWLYGKHCCREALKNDRRKHVKLLAAKTIYETAKKWAEQSQQQIPIVLASEEEIKNAIMPKKNELCSATYCTPRSSAPNNTNTTSSH